MSPLEKDPLYQSLMGLRKDATNRGFLDLAIVYGWSLLRLGEETIEKMKRNLHGHAQS